MAYKDQSVLNGFSFRFVHLPDTKKEIGETERVGPCMGCSAGVLGATVRFHLLRTFRGLGKKSELNESSNFIWREKTDSIVLNNSCSML